MVLVGKKAPNFSTKAVVNGGEIVDGFSLEQFIGKKHVLFFFYLRILLLFAHQNYTLSKLNWI